MGFSRSEVRRTLIAAGISDENIDKALNDLISLHVSVVDPLKENNDELKHETAKLTEVQAELEKVKKDLETANKTIETANKEDYKGKYEKANADLEKLKNDYATKETVANQKSVLKGGLKAAGYSDASQRLIVNRSDYASKIEFDKDGNATNLDAIIKDIQADGDFSGFTPKVETEKHTPANPPANSGGKNSISWDDIDKIKDTAERQKAMIENMESLGIK